MTVRCDRCGDRIDGREFSYRMVRPEEDERGEYCSVNCLLNTGRFDEESVRERLESAARAEVEV